MANVNEVLSDLMTTDGAIATAVVDSTSGMTLGSAGSGIDIELAAAGNTEVMRSKLKTIKALGLNQGIEDLLITLEHQYHIIRPLAEAPEVFIYLALEKSRSNLALARRAVVSADASLQL